MENPAESAAQPAKSPRVDRALALPVCFFLLLSSCQVQWVSMYDETFDRQVTAFQKTTHTHLEKLKTMTWPDCGYDANEDFYIGLVADVQVIVTRAESLEMNDQTVSQAKALRDNTSNLRDTHKASTQACLSDSYLAMSQRLFDQIVRATLWLEHGKKRKFLNSAKEDQEQRDTLPTNLIPAATEGTSN